MTDFPNLTLKSGIQIPQLGFGTWKISDEVTCRQAVNDALAAGYRHFDTAQFYQNEFFIGSTLRDSGIERNSLFITTKISNDNQGWDDLIPSFSNSLRQLQTTYVDLLLLHFPVTQTRRQAWLRMEELLRAGHVRAIGVSNYTIRHLTELLNESGVKPAVNQVELHVFLQQPELVAFCRENDIAVEAYSPLAQGHGLDNAVLQAIAKKHHKTPAQIMLRWGVQEGMIVIPKSTHKERIVENTQIFDFTLDKDDMLRIVTLNDGMRTAWDPTSVV